MQRQVDDVDGDDGLDDGPAPMTLGRRRRNRRSLGASLALAISALVVAPTAVDANTTGGGCTISIDSNGVVTIVCDDPDVPPPPPPPPEPDPEPPARKTASLEAGDVVRVNVPEARGGQLVVGQIAAERMQSDGFVTAYGCDDGIPRGADGEISKADLNYDGRFLDEAAFDFRFQSVTSNRLLVTADADGDVCFYTSEASDLIIDMNGVSAGGITSIPNDRTNTRVSGQGPTVAAGESLTINVPSLANGGGTVFGQVAVAKVSDLGFVTAYPCADGIPRNEDGAISKADLSYDGRTLPVASNRLIAQADANGNLCLYTSVDADFIVDINATSVAGIEQIDQDRRDTRQDAQELITPSTPLKVNVAGAGDGTIVLGQLSVAKVEDKGFVTTYPCADGILRDAAGNISKADLNFEGSLSPRASNRLIGETDANGDICFYTSADVAFIVDIGAVTNTVITPIVNLRTDTRP